MKKFVNFIATNLRMELLNKDEEKSKKAFDIVFNAYNKFQEEERDGLDYIFKADNADDTKTLGKGGYTFIDFMRAYNASPKKSDYFMAGINHVGIEFMDKKEVVRQLSSYLNEIVIQTIINPYLMGYKELYNEYIKWEYYHLLVLDEEQEE
jgi:hypothetical protein